MTTRHFTAHATSAAADFDTASLPEANLDHQAAVAGGGVIGQPGRALRVAESTFRLLVTGPTPLALDGAAIGCGLPARPVDLAELRKLLLSGSASDELKDAAWRELIALARTGDPAWVVGCVGVAMPSLKKIAARLVVCSPERVADDAVSELLTEFVAQLASIDVVRPWVCSRLLHAARKRATRATVARERGQVPTDPHTLACTQAAPETEPAELLADAARQAVITASAAALIKATRLDGVSVAEYAAAHGIGTQAAYKQRERAEARLVSAIREGHVFANSVGPVSKSEA